MGILLAVTALFSWGLGDFLIQRSARKFGDWMALFYITAFGAIVLFPFVYRDIGSSLDAHSALLWMAGLVMLFAGVLDFEALKVGKISVAEPILVLEIPTAAFLAAYFIGERPSFPQIFFVTVLMVGIFLVATRSFSHFKNIHLERGAWYAVFAAGGMGTANFLFGLGARATNPLVVNWLADIFVAVVTLVYLGAHSRLGEVARDFKKNKLLIINVSFFDNLAWVAFASAALFIPIAVASGVSEGYIALAGGLGVLFNREKLGKHQWVGFFLTMASVIVLAFITDRSVVYIARFPDIV